jgi:hypothetical protein
MISSQRLRSKLAGGSLVPQVAPVLSESALERQFARVRTIQNLVEQRSLPFTDLGVPRIPIRRSSAPSWRPCAAVTGCATIAPGLTGKTEPTAAGPLRRSGEALALRTEARLSPADKRKLLLQTADHKKSRADRR